MSFRKFFASALIAFTCALPTVTAHASPTNSGYTWQLTVYVDQYRDKSNGDVVVYFEDASGNPINSWPGSSSGGNICTVDNGLIIDQGHPMFEQLGRTILAAGLARRKIKIAYEGISGTCYIKQTLVEM